MLQNLSEEIRECYHHAEDARRKAEAAANPFTKNDFLDVEQRWLFLARSYEFAECLSNFSTTPFSGRKAQKE
jgi:hypothetical protein